MIRPFEIKDLTEEEMRTILLTCDGKGVRIKEQVLDELLRAARQEGATRPEHYNVDA